MNDFKRPPEVYEKMSNSVKYYIHVHNQGRPLELKTASTKISGYVRIRSRYLAWPSTILQKCNIIILWGISHDITRISSWSDEKFHDFVRFLGRHLVFISRFDEKFLILITILQNDNYDIMRFSQADSTSSHAGTP